MRRGAVRCDGVRHGAARCGLVYAGAYAPIALLSKSFAQLQTTPCWRASPFDLLLTMSFSLAVYAALLLLASLVGVSVCYIAVHLLSPHPQPGSRQTGLAFSASTTLRAHGTTNLEFSVPYPSAFHHEIQPAMMRVFTPTSRR